MKGHPGKLMPEVAAAGLAIVTVVAVQLLFARGTTLFSRPFWADELFTVYAVQAKGTVFVQFFTAPVETNLPVLHVLLKGWALVFGVSEISFRAFALASVCVALLGFYVYCRALTSPLAAAAGVAVLWSHPLVLDHAFQARYYGVWLAASVFFLLALQVTRLRRRAVWVGLTAALLCGIHLFGILSWLVITAAHLWRSPGDRSALRSALVGPLVTVTAVPLMLHQRRQLAVPTWIPSLRPTQAARLGAEFIGDGGLALLVFVAVLGFVLLKQRPRELLPGTPLQMLPALLLAPGLFGALFLISVVVQPSFVERYAITGTLSGAAAAALVMQVVPSRAVGFAGVIAVLALGTQQLRWHSDGAVLEDQRKRSLVASATALAGGRPIVFERLHDALVIQRYQPEAGTWFLRHRRAFTGDLAANLERLSGVPRTIEMSALAESATDGFVLVRSAEEDDASPWMPPSGFEVVSRHDGLLLVEPIAR